MTFVLVFLLLLLKTECKSTRSARSKTFQNEQIIDYCNYLLQTHFRMESAFKMFGHSEQNSERILSLVFNILTDSLALINTFSIEEAIAHSQLTGNHLGEDGGESMKRRSNWNELFVASYKEMKRFMRGRSNVKTSSTKPPPNAQCPSDNN